MLSILVAARNEERNIGNLLQSLLNQNTEQPYEVLIANDDSNDNTGKIIRDFQEKHPEKIRYFLINKDVIEAYPTIKGKTRALAHLAHHANGHFFFICDADMTFPVEWLHSLYEIIKQNQTIGLANGITQVKENSLFATCQCMEWLSALRLMQILSSFGLETTGLGNNMVISKAAYFSTGGYEKMPFSIVEDYALYKAVLREGFDFKQAYTKQVLGTTLPPENYFEQRKRWISGALNGKSLLLLPSLIQAFLGPTLLFLTYFNLPLALILFLAVFGINTLLGFLAFKPLNKLYLMAFLPIYTLYLLVFWFLQMIYFLLPTPIRWKGRTY